MYHPLSSADEIATIERVLYWNQAAAQQEDSAMVDELRRVFEQAQQQPEDVQRRIAELVALELEGREWDALVSSPQGQETLERLAAEAREEIARGDVDEGV